MMESLKKNWISYEEARKFNLEILEDLVKRGVIHDWLCFNCELQYQCKRERLMEKLMCPEQKGTIDIIYPSNKYYWVIILTNKETRFLGIQPYMVVRKYEYGQEDYIPKNKLIEVEFTAEEPEFQKVVELLKQ